MAGANLQGADLTGAYLCGADLRGAAFDDRTALSGAVVDSDSVLPALPNGLSLDTISTRECRRRVGLTPAEGALLRQEQESDVPLRDDTETGEEDGAATEPPSADDEELVSESSALEESEAQTDEEGATVDAPQ